MPFPVFPKKATGNPRRRTAIALQLAVCDCQFYGGFILLN
jgi:hypothetical protein